MKLNSKAAWNALLGQVIEFTEAIDDTDGIEFDYDVESGLRGRVIGIIFDEFETRDPGEDPLIVSVTIDMRPFEEYNQRKMQPRWFDSNGEATKRWFETNLYEPVHKTYFYFDFEKHKGFPLFNILGSTTLELQDLRLLVEGAVAGYIDSLSKDELYNLWLAFPDKIRQAMLPSGEEKKGS